MELTNPSPPEPTALRVPFGQASPQQVSQALLYAQDELQGHFSTLSWTAWANALHGVQPDLWVAQQVVYLDKDGMTHLTQRLAAASGEPEFNSLIHGPRAGYLAKRLVNYQDEAIHALADIEAHPEAYGLLVYRLVTDLALGNAVADEVFRATHRGPQARGNGQNPVLARAEVHGRLRALRRARGAFG
ncbi:MAG TPA: hypothetical protein VF690_18765 [Hymenobacter sp.]|jgi:hypothetical protein